MSQILQIFNYISDFLKVYLPTVRCRDPDTIESYRFSLNLYISYMESLGIPLSKLKVDHFSQKNIIEFLDWLQTTRNNVAPTLNHRLSDVRGFCEYLRKKGVMSVIDFEAIADISMRKDDRVIEFTYLTLDDVQLVLNQPNQAKRLGVRDYFFLSLLYESGCRDDEILSCKVKDFVINDNQESEFHVIGKGKKQRTTPLSKDIIVPYNAYMSRFHSVKDPNDFLFYTVHCNSHTQMSQDNVQRLMLDYEKTAKQTNPELLHLHPHLFRRTRAMHLYEAGVPLPRISEWLGHSQMETTRLYAQITIEMKRKELAKLGEGANAVFNNNVEFKYDGDEEILKKLCGLTRI